MQNRRRTPEREGGAADRSPRSPKVLSGASTIQALPSGPSWKSMRRGDGVCKGPPKASTAAAPVGCGARATWMTHPNNTPTTIAASAMRIRIGRLIRCGVGTGGLACSGSAASSCSRLRTTPSRIFEQCLTAHDLGNGSVTLRWCALCTLNAGRGAGAPVHPHLAYEWPKVGSRFPAEAVEALVRGNPALL
jgi:hypothetical protein